MYTKQTVLIALALAFTIIAYTDFITALHIPPQWDAYVRVGGAILIVAGFFNLLQKKL
jgi:hypothetical protein